MRRRKDPKQKTPQARKTPTTPTTATSAGALHPIRGTAPVMGRCTRYVAVHPNRRGALPTDRVQCPNAQEQTRNWHTEPLTSAPLHAQLGPTGGRMGTPPTPPTPPPALRPNPTPPTPLHAKSRLTPPTAPRRNGSEPIARQAGQPAGFSETSARTRLGPSAVARMPRYWGRHAKQPMVRWSCAGVRLRHVMSMSVGVGLAVVMT